MGSQHRRERVEELVRSFIASELMLNEEPALSLVTITAAKVSPDLKHALLYWCKANALPQESADANTEIELKAAIPHLRKRIAESLGLRYVPMIKFEFDRTPFMSERINTLLKTKV